MKPNTQADAGRSGSGSGDVGATGTSIQAALGVLLEKDGAGLGGLTPPQRALSLGLAAAVLPSDTPMREADVNEALRAALRGPCRFLSTDHVELRRWLVDLGWLARDGFGREYRRVGLQALAPEQARIAEALQGLDLWALATQLREQAAQARAERKAAWQRRAADAAVTGRSARGTDR